jgi:hypothetical protein
MDNSTVNNPSAVTPGGQVLIDSRFDVQVLKDNFLFGLRLEDSEGNPFPENLYYHHLNAAIQNISGLLDIVLVPTEFVEEHDYYVDDFQNWGFLKLFKKPAVQVSKMEIMFADTQVTQFPLSWIALTKLNSLIRLVPNMGSVDSLIISADGSLVQPFFGSNHYPQMWKVTYTAGFNEIPYDIYDYVYKKAAINVIQVWYNMFYIGHGASESISIDGLSQSVTKPPLQLYNQYNAELQDALSTLKSRYDGIRFTVV